MSLQTLRPTSAVRGAVYRPHSADTPLCVPDPKIVEVMSMQTGQHIESEKVIGTDYAALLQLRMQLAEAIACNEPLYTCSICGVGVYLVCTCKEDKKRFHFRHQTEDGRCPAVTRGELSADEINKRKYNGAKESHDHIRMKEILAESLACDSNFSGVEVEKVWRGRDRSVWRKPDVRAIWRNTTPVAFEVQLSTTFLHVIAGRRQFYREQGGLLCWVFKSFDAESARLTQDDVFFNNNQNLFLASEETLRESQQKGALVLNCRWTEPVLQRGAGIVEEWRGCPARFEEMTLDLEKQRVFLVDHSAARAGLLVRSAEAELRQRFATWWQSHDWPPNDATWKGFREELKARSIFLPEWPTDVRSLLHSLYSAKAGAPVGYRNPKFISVAHTIANSHKDQLQAFRAALHVFNRADQIRSEDPPEPGQTEGKWARKVRAYKKQLQAGDPDYARDKRLDPLIALLFPEVWAQLVKWESQTTTHA